MKSLKFKTSIRILMLVIAFYCAGYKINAQDIKQEKKAQLESQKVAFISKKVELSVTEAQKFWPLYNELHAKKEAILKQKREIFQKINKKNGEIPEAELEKISDEFIQLQMKEGTLAQEYHSRFKEVLGVRKTIDYYKAEEQFKQWLLGEMKKNQANK